MARAASLGCVQADYKRGGGGILARFRPRERHPQPQSQPCHLFQVRGSVGFISLLPRKDRKAAPTLLGNNWPSRAHFAGHVESSI
eukprot:2219976-Pyramimonas_sp.AAC.1